MATDTIIILTIVFVVVVIIYLFGRFHEQIKYNKTKPIVSFGLSIILLMLAVFYLFDKLLTENLNNTDSSYVANESILSRAILPENKIEKSPTVNNVISPNIEYISIAKDTQHQVAEPQNIEVDKNTENTALLSNANISELPRNSTPGEEIDQEPAEEDVIGTIIEKRKLTTGLGIAVDENQIEMNRNVSRGTERVIAGSASLEEEIADFLNIWRKAWENTAGPEGDMETFSTYYAQTFSRGNKNRSEWLAEKERKNRRKSWIKISISKIKVELLKDEKVVSASFFQDYSSSNYSQKSLKRVLLRREKNNWQIISVEEI